MSDINPPGLEKLNRDGIELFANGNLIEALALFSTAIEVDPNYLPSYSNRAKLFDALGRVGDASRDRLIYNTLGSGARFDETGQDPTSTTADGEAGNMLDPGSTALISESHTTEPTDIVISGDNEGEPVSTGINMVGDEGEHQDNKGLETSGDNILPKLPRLAIKEIIVSNKRLVAPTTVYHNRKINSLLRVLREYMSVCSVERLLASLLLLSTMGLVGVWVARSAYCPEGITAQFWSGCNGETLVFGIVGGLCGIVIAMFSCRFILR